MAERRSRVLRILEKEAKLLADEFEKREWSVGTGGMLHVGGKPVTVYHGTTAKFKRFKPGTPVTPTGTDHPGIYFFR
jgi:hypothetical protein